jgi:hypothetical protein
MKNTVDFTVDVKGEVSGNSFVGGFTAKTKLSFRESLAQDEDYRRILGVNSQEASPNSKSIAGAISYLARHIIKCPDWWTSLEGGLKCEDMNLLAEINNNCQEAIEAEYKALAGEAQKAEDILKALPTT